MSIYVPLLCLVHSAHTQKSHVTTSTDYDETIVISVQEGVTSNRSSADAKGLKLTLSRFGNMNFSDDESSGPNSIVNSSNPNESKQFDFSPTTQKAATEKSVERSLYIEEEEVKEENATMSTAEGTSNSTEAAATVGADTSTSAVAAVAVGSTETAAEITNASVDKPLPKPLDITPKNRSKNRLVVRRSSLLATAGTPAEAAEATPATTSSSSAGTVAVTAAPQLAAHLTPMPAGSTVRRLSTLTSRTPFNSTTTPSPSAASAAADAATVDAAAVGSVGGATGDARTTANTTSSSKEKAETNTINHTTEHLNAPSVDSGAATPVLSMKPLFFRSSLSPESTCDSPSAELGENTAGAIVSEVHETVSPLVAAVLTAPSSGSVLPVEELLSGVATQLTEADSVTDAAAQGTAAANVTADIAADANNAESVTDEVDGGGGGAADRTESTATTENLGESAQDNAASGPGTKGNNKKGGKKNRNRK